MEATRDAAVRTPPVTYRGVTRDGVAWQIALASGTPAVGETMAGTVSFDGEHQPQITGGTAELTARSSRSSTVLDVGSMVTGAIDRSGDDDGEVLPTKTTTTGAQVLALKEPIRRAAGLDGSSVGTFELAIPISAPPRLRLTGLTTEWTLRLTLDASPTPIVLEVSDLPVRLTADRIAETPYLAAGAADAVVSGTKDDISWSIELESVPLVPDGRYRGTLSVTATDRMRTAHPVVRFQGRVWREGQRFGRLDWIERGVVVGDRIAADGRRQIDFEGHAPKAAFVTTGVGDTRLVATLGISMFRWRWFGPEFERPVAIASPS